MTRLHNELGVCGRPGRGTLSYGFLDTLFWCTFRMMVFWAESANKFNAISGHRRAEEIGLPVALNFKQINQILFLGNVLNVSKLNAQP